MFKTINWPNNTNLHHWDTKKIKTIQSFYVFLNFDLANGRALAPLTPLVAPLLASNARSFRKDKSVLPRGVDIQGKSRGEKSKIRES